MEHGQLIVLINKSIINYITRTIYIFRTESSNEGRATCFWTIVDHACS